ncbi:MAG TPA: hypothetical protein PLG47_03545 [Candidatus Dojkabacteria bacterium]|nr:hypothetical protein [Candidatus Dojkabacteria bacterium]
MSEMTPEDYDEFLRSRLNQEQYGGKMFQEEMTSPEFMAKMITPDLQSAEQFKDFLSKELKVSNIKSTDVRKIVEMNDLAFQTRKLGACDFSDFLILLKETTLSASSSVKGFERTMEASNINIHSLDEKKGVQMKDRLLGRG